MTKEEIRKLYLAKRKSMDPEEVNRLSEDIKSRLVSYLNAFSFRYIHIFLPIKKNNEVNTWSIIKHYRLAGKHIITSLCPCKSLEMKSYLLKENTKLRVNKWGVPEPINAQSFDDIKIEVVLVPLLSFDRKGYRVGYGKGFYDRFFLKCNQATKKIGLSLEPPLGNIQNKHEQDIPLDATVTPDCVYEF